MKKLIALIFTILALTGTVAFAEVQPVSYEDQYNLKTQVLDNRSQFYVTPMGSALVFGNIPSRITYDEILIEVYDGDFRGILTTYTSPNTGSTGFTQSISDLSDGKYVIYASLMQAGKSEFAADFGISITNGTAKLYMPDKHLGSYRDLLKYMKDSPKDKYNLDLYKYLLNSPRMVKFTAAQAKALVAGVTDDYEKVAIIQDYVFENFLNPAMSTGMCEIMSDYTRQGLQDIGFPTKKTCGISYVSSTSRTGHVWNEVWLDGRWVAVDSTWGYSYEWLDPTPYKLSDNHYVSTPAFQRYQSTWSGSVLFMDGNFKVLKTIPNVTLGAVLPSAYGYNVNDLYTGATFTNRFDIKNTPINSQTYKIFVKTTTTPAVVKPVPKKTYTVTFKTNGGTYIKPAYVYSGSKLIQPKAPTRKGLKFVAWYKDAKLTKKWNFATDKVTVNTVLYAGWSE